MLLVEVSPRRAIRAIIRAKEICKSSTVCGQQRSEEIQRTFLGCVDRYDASDFCSCFTAGIKVGSAERPCDNSVMEWMLKLIIADGDGTYPQSKN